MSVLATTMASIAVVTTVLFAHALTTFEGPPAPRATHISDRPVAALLSSRSNALGFQSGVARMVSVEGESLPLAHR